MSGTAIEAGIQYGPTASGKSYLSSHTHRDKEERGGKSCWADDLEPDEEYAIFETSDNGEVSDGRGDIWGVRNKGGSTLGAR